MIFLLKGVDPFTAEPIHRRDNHAFVMEKLVSRYRSSSSAFVQAVHSFAKSEKSRAPQEDRGKVTLVAELWTINAVVVKAPAAVLVELARRSDVARAIQDRPIPLPKTTVRRARHERAFTYGLQKLNIDRVHTELGLRGEGVVIGHLDTGVDSGHPDLTGTVLAFKNFMPEGGSTPFDDQGHGTHTAGTLVGSNTSGTAIGVAPKAKLISGKIFPAMGSTTLAIVLAGMNWIADPDGNPQTNDAPAVCSNSWGQVREPEEAERPLWEMVRTWVRLGIFPCFAAGNGGPAPRSVETPGGYPHSFAVGATTENDEIADFSARGPILWGSELLSKPDVSAPGASVYSAAPGGTYVNLDGTSMATPHAAGLAALILGDHPNFTVEQVASILKQSAKDLGPAGPDPSFGEGRLDGYKACQLARSAGTLEIRMQNEGAQPVSGRVSAVTSQTALVSTVPASGTVSLILAAGSYGLRASSYGYQESTSNTATVVQGQTRTIALTLHTAPTAPLNVTILDRATNSPLPGKVKVIDTPVPEAVAGADGHAVCTLAEGTYRIRVKAFAHEPQQLEGVHVVTNGTSITVKLAHVPRILLYDQDGGASYESFFKSTLEALNEPFTHVDAAASGDLDEDDILGYPVVVYLTGGSFENVLPAGVERAFRRLVATGGRLILTGKDIAYGLQSSSFLTEMLGARHIGDTTNHHVQGEGLSFDIEGGDGANNQKLPDRIAPADGSPGTPFFQYGDGQGPAGLEKRHGNGRVLFLPFGFEAISTAAHRQAVMTLLLSRAAPNFVEEATRLPLLSRALGAEAGRLYYEYLAEKFQKLPPIEQEAHRGLLRLVPSPH